MTRLVLEEAPDPIPVTVTFLEMTKAPTHLAPLPVGHQLALLRAKDVPLHFYRYLIDRTGRKWHWVNALRLDDEGLSARLREPDREVRVLYLDGVPAGFFEIKPRLPDSVEIAYLGLMEHALGLRLGRWFLGAALEAAWAHAPRSVVVQTCTLDHPAALPLYQKLGFAPTGQEATQVQPLTMHERSTVVMRP